MLINLFEDFFVSIALPSVQICFLELEFITF